MSIVQQVVGKTLPEQVCLEYRRRNVVNDSADVTSSGRSFNVCGPATGKAQVSETMNVLD